MRSWHFTGTPIAALLANTWAFGAGAVPSPDDRAALAALKGRVTGQIIWESNRTGKWQLYTMNADGTGARQLTNGDQECTQASLSSNGKRVLFTKRASPVRTDVWLMNHDGTGARKLIDNASSPNWRKRDQAVQFYRMVSPGSKQRQTWEFSLIGGQERMLFPPAGVDFRMEIWGALGNDSGTRFVLWSPKPRGTWVVSADGTLQEHVHPGCECQVASTQQYGYGVETAGRFVRFNLSDGAGKLAFNQRTGPWSHTYFPCVSHNADWLVYGACPPGQHNQDTSDYELFLTPLRDWTTPDDPVRLTFNTRTDRWPTIYIASRGTGNPLPDGPIDTINNRATNPPPPPLAIHTFTQDGVAPDFGGAWGVWPTEGTCRGTATFMPGADAEGGQGGSTKIDYQIEGAPNSVAVWFTPANNALDLTAYNRLVLWAKGNIPSFTLVVEDANADAEGGRKGVGDFVVTNVTGDWKRFEAPFRSFRARELQKQVDWSNVKLIAVALIRPNQPKAGTLQVDNLRAVAGE